MPYMEHPFSIVKPLTSQATHHPFIRPNLEAPTDHPRPHPDTRAPHAAVGRKLGELGQDLFRGLQFFSHLRGLHRKPALNGSMAMEMENGIKHVNGNQTMDFLW